MSILYYASSYVVIFACMNGTSNVHKPLVGIAACSLTGSPNLVIQLAEKLKPDFIELKTCRPYENRGHSLPHTAKVVTEYNKQYTWYDLQRPLYTTNNPIYFCCPKNIALANSVGLPSPPFLSTAEHVLKTQQAFLKKNIPTKLIFSVYGNNLIEFKAMAHRGALLGVDYVCANFSCPNVDSFSPIYKEPIRVSKILNVMKEQLGPIPLIAKIGVFSSMESKLMDQTINAIADTGAWGVYGINTIPAEVLQPDNTPHFGDNRRVCGISGSPIRSLALDFTRRAKEIITRNHLNLKLIACGGVTDYEHIDLFAQAGADIVMSATGVMCNPEFSFKPKSKL